MKTQEEIVTKKCVFCKIEQNITEFRKEDFRYDGVYPRCNTCVRRTQREKYKNNKEHRERMLNRPWMGGDKKKIAVYNKKKYYKFREKILAQCKLKYAVKAGKIKKLPCEKCGNTKSQGHHEDYSKPLEVIWLCDLHHKQAHGRLVAVSLPL